MILPQKTQSVFLQWNQNFSRGIKMKKGFYKKLTALCVVSVLLLSLFPAAVLADDIPTSGYTGEIVEFPNVDYPTVFEAYITRTGSELIDGEQPFRFIGYNAPNSVLSEDPDYRTLTNFEIEDLLKSAKQSNSKVLRISPISFQIYRPFRRCASAQKIYETSLIRAVMG
jgi:hypothetical protein